LPNASCPSLLVRTTCRAFLFDLDGVLVDSRAVVERTWQRWAERHGIDPAPFLRIAHGRRARDTLQAINPSFARDEEVAWLDAAELVDLAGLRPIPGAVGFLSSLPEQARAIVTSCGRALAMQRLTAAGVPVPALLVTSDDVVHGKPSPEGYRLGARRLGVDPGSCVVFEDAPPGIAAGKAAGCRVIGVATTHPAAELRQADHVIPDLTHVRAYPRDGAFDVEAG
jgi:mannitol-1-/sugar-/sorbitol-6-phosphatase